MAQGNGNKKEVLLADRFRLKSKVGSGSFGEVYAAVNVNTGRYVAVKMESRGAQHPQLLYESKVYKLLEGGTGIPRLHYFGFERESTCMVIDFLGPSLEDLFVRCGCSFSLKTVLMLADRMLSRLEYLHSKHFIHQDIKPQNFLIGTGLDCNEVFIIDFGLAKKYRDTITGLHIAYRDGKSWAGTARYASVNAHIGIEQSRRDDLEALGYLLVYFLKGALPWQGLAARNKNAKYEKISLKKQQTSFELLCKDIPQEFVEYFKYCRGLRFDETPNYSALRQRFRTLFNLLGYQADGKYDWNLRNGMKSDRCCPEEPKETHKWTTPIRQVLFEKQETPSEMPQENKGWSLFKPPGQYVRCFHEKQESFNSTNGAHADNVAVFGTNDISGLFEDGLIVDHLETNLTLNLAELQTTQYSATQSTVSLDEVAVEMTGEDVEMDDSVDANLHFFRHLFKEFVSLGAKKQKDFKKGVIELLYAD